MTLPGTPSLVFLAYLLVILPWMAFRSAQRIRRAGEAGGAPLPPREAIWKGTIVIQCALFALAWFTGRSFGYEIFAMPAPGARQVLAAAAALALTFVLRAISRAIRTEDERRKMTVFLLAPRTTPEWVWWSATVLVASVTEEAAYRGVGMSILWYSLGNGWLAAGISAIAFALAHWTQGWKSGLIILAIALVMHSLVAITGTLVLAMIVHATYDFVAGAQIAKEARGYDRITASPLPPT